MSQRAKPQDLYETQEQFRDDELVEFIKFNPSKAEVELGETTYHAISQELVNE